MADWIKMRTDLWTDPRVVRICSLLSCGAASATGALFMFWSLADTYSNNGLILGYSPDDVDDFVGIKGFVDALQDPSVGWVKTGFDNGCPFIQVVDFKRHNGRLAKRRALTSKRVKRFRERRKKLAEDVTQKRYKCNDVTRYSVTNVTQKRYKCNGVTLDQNEESDHKLLQSNDITQNDHDSACVTSVTSSVTQQKKEKKEKDRKREREERESNTKRKKRERERQKEKEEKEIMTEIAAQSLYQNQDFDSVCEKTEIRGYSEAFQAWWTVYPRKIGKRKASLEWERAIHRIEAANSGWSIFDARKFLVDKASEFAASEAGQAGSFVPHPTTWLHQGRYDDDPAEWQRSRNDDGKPKLSASVPDF